MLYQRVPTITDRSVLSINRYLTEVGQLNKSRDTCSKNGVQNTEFNLARHQKKLVINNLAFVITIAKQYQFRGLPLEDLINEGNIGLIRASKTYKDQGHKFITYAVWWIRESITSAISNHGTIVRLPDNKLNTLNGIRKFTALFEQQHLRVPTSAELAEALDDNVETIANVLRSQLIEQPSCAAGNDQKESDLMDQLSDNTTFADDGLNREYSTTIVRDLLNNLNLRERQILEFHFGLGNHTPRSFKEIAGSCGITSERVRQIKEQSLVKLRKFISRDLLE
ncbi:hypothetical protein BEL04_09005 [Mucilaginibacter sp. PPCGB 2223]|uniref:sigma-70 family RNA polymerase sigma factor n=1 Tax=Mucilaginibacter sp. PPCGB 2223 TaxID=1886027 RepID=UPI00082483F6|nr:sigma-70 family RNA polymerase sigma factor [Mucilaginibacter sp. PPCGB 2223]OCX54383.1 hypothetical protein BEL04_09005 [Mucilaginibacter sp. PPCGB 2223]